MNRRGNLHKNYYIDTFFVADIGEQIDFIMKKTDNALENAERLMYETSMLLLEIPEEVRSNALKHICEKQYRERKEIDFLSYGYKVKNALWKLADDSNYVNHKFVQDMKYNIERAKVIREKCKGLSICSKKVIHTDASLATSIMKVKKISCDMEEIEKVSRKELLQFAAEKLAGISMNSTGGFHVNSAEDAARVKKYYQYMNELKNGRYSDAEITAIIMGIPATKGVPNINNAEDAKKYSVIMRQLKVISPDTLSHFNYNWTKDGTYVTQEFLDKVIEISNKLGVLPDDLMAVMAFESRFNPQCVNSSGACGLIQFTNISIIQINNNNGTNYTSEDIYKMNALEQLDLVYLHCKGQGNISTLSDLYMSIICPEAVGKEEDYVMYAIGTAAYEQNKGLDLNNDGKITKEEATTKVLERRTEYE